MNLNARLRIGLTGGIASGKSVVADMFAARGITVIDTDLLARAVVEPGQPGLEAVVREFGDEIILPDGTLYRARLRKIVFAKPDSRQRLESILHPLIRSAALEQAAKSAGPYIIFAVPLLVETGFRELVDRVLVVDCPTDLQRKRLMSRDGETKASADAIISAQASREQRLALADDIIVNDATLQNLQQAVEDLHRRYQELAASGAVVP